MSRYLFPQTPVERSAWREDVVDAVASLCSCAIVLMGEVQPAGERWVAARGTALDATTSAKAMTDLVPLGEEVVCLDEVPEIGPGREEGLRGSTGLMVAPMHDDEGRRVGCLCCARRDGEAFTAHDVSFACTMAHLASARLMKERKTALDADLRASAALLERLTVCVPGVLYQFRMTPDGRSAFPYSSDGIRAIYGVDPEEVQCDATKAWETLHPEDVARVEESVKTSAAMLTVWRDRYRVIDTDGDVRWVEGEAKPEREPDGATLWHGYIRDVTQEVEREARLEEARKGALDAARAKSAFLANNGHEIRTPIGAVLGYAEILEEQAWDSEAQDVIRTIRRNGEHLLGLVNDLLDVSKIEADKLSIERIETDPQEILADVVALLRVRSDAKGLRLIGERVGDAPQRISTDPTRLRQVLINLVGNAIKFTNSGSVTVRMRFEKTPATRLIYEVIDTGIGMTPEQVVIIKRFEPFTQGDNTMTRRFGGTGLGLRISASLSERLGDGLEIESEMGVGSTFRVRIDPGDLDGVPMRQGEACLVSGGVEQRETPLGRMRILLADDAPDNQRLIGHHLRNAGAEVVIANDGQEACEIAMEHDDHFDIVLMDVMMPVMDGYAATRHLRACGFTRPIVAVTAHAGDEQRVLCLEAGCDGLLTKPVASNTLVNACLRYTRSAAA